MSTVRRVALRTATTLLLLAAVAGATPAPGRADDGTALVSATPPDGAALVDAPPAVELTFNRTPDPALSHVGAADGTSSLLNTGELTAAGPRTLRQTVGAAAKGTVVVAYHVVFSDGTQATGSIRFSVGTGVAPATADKAQRAAESAALGHQHRIDPLSAALLVVDFGALLGVVALLILRPRRRGDTELGGPEQAGVRTASTS